MIDPDLLSALRCPETLRPLQLADPSLIEHINSYIAAGTVRDRSDRAVKLFLEGGLIRDDGLVLYPIRQGVPIMLVEESIPLG